MRARRCTAFVAAGFEHSIANMYFFPLALLLGAPVGWGDFPRNIVPVVGGHLVGGSVLVAFGYHLIYVRLVNVKASSRAGDEA